MPSLNFAWVDVFTTTRFAGNPLSIVKVPRGHDLSTEKMQTIAFEFNLSETLFIHERQQSNNNDEIPEWRVRIFFPTEELPFAGHPTIGAACYAMSTLAPSGAQKGRLICNAGPIELDYHDGVAKASIPHNFHQHTEVPFTLEQAYELQPSLRKANIVPAAIDTLSPVKGMNFVCVELPDLETLGRLHTSAVMPKPTLDEGWRSEAPGSYWYVITERETGRAKLRTRMIEGGLEDPATGSAACALSAFLAMKWRDSREVKFEITQAVEMGRQSDIGVVVTLKEGLDALEKVELSGSAVKVMEGVVEY